MSSRLVRLVLGGAFAVVLGACSLIPLAPSTPVPPLPLAHQGRWFTDPSGRVVMLRGVNFVEKWAPYTPEAAGFDDDDAALIAGSGFNTVRLGVVFGFLMPQPGVIDTSYLDSIARTASILGQHGLYVLLDFHQDGWGPAVHGNGMPEWATLTDGLPNPPVDFPLYYIENPALQRAFDNFWANRAGPDGVPLQQHYAEGMQAVARRFAASPYVLGYEAMNEPWPGTDWSSCLTGCPDLEQSLLAPFYARVTTAVRAVDRHHPVFVEPFTLFNFGESETTLPGAGSPNALATHVYATSPELNAAVMDNTVSAATRDNAPFLITEWGAITDAAQITQMESQLDDHLAPWLFWSYNGTIVADSTKPLLSGNVNTTVLDALVRPYPVAVNGTPRTIHYDPATATFDFSYSTSRPDGRVSPPGLGTVVSVPPIAYPNGYAVTVTGADVISRPCAAAVWLRNQPGASTVTVHVVPAADCAHH